MALQSTLGVNPFRYTKVSDLFIPMGGLFRAGFQAFTFTMPPNMSLGVRTLNPLLSPFVGALLFAVEWRVSLHLFPPRPRPDLGHGWQFSSHPSPIVCLDI